MIMNNVHLGVIYDYIQRKILKESRDLVASEGLDALSIRKLAKNVT